MYRGAVVMEFRCNALPSYCNTQKMPTSQAEADVQEVVDLLSRLSEESLGCCHFRRQNWGGGVPVGVGWCDDSLVRPCLINITFPSCSSRVQQCRWTFPKASSMCQSVGLRFKVSEKAKTGAPRKPLARIGRAETGSGDQSLVPKERW